MIEVNVKAKPYNAAEEIIGSEAFWMLTECQLVGSRYFYENPPKEKGFSVLGAVKAGKFNQLDKLLSKNGWKIGGGPVPSVDTYFRMREVDGVEFRDDVSLTSSFSTYDAWINAAEVVRLLRLDGQNEEDRQLSKMIHQIVMQGYRLKTIKGELVLGPPQKHHPAHEDGPQGGFGWHPPDGNIPQPVQQAAAVAGAEFVGQFGNGILQGAQLPAGHWEPIAGGNVQGQNALHVHQQLNAVADMEMQAALAALVNPEQDG